MSRAGTLFFFIFLLSCLVFPSSLGAKIYIDITSPRQQLPLAIHDLDGPKGGEISEILRADLDFTGFFIMVDQNAFLETDTEPFSPANWSSIGVQAVVKGTTEQSEGKLIVNIYLYDVADGTALIKRKYWAGQTLIRPLAHSIADDLYRELTGEPGVFRTKTAFIEKSGGSVAGGSPRLTLMDWDGHNIRRPGIGGDALLAPHWSDDASMLLYSASRSRQWGIYVLDFAVMKEKHLFGDRGTNIAGDFFPGGKEFSLSSSKAGTPDIYIYDIAESKLERLTKDGGIEVSPTVSPDGKTIAFVSDRGGTPQIYIMDKVGYNIHRITYSGSYNTSPSWSPRGDLIAFSGRREGKNQIFIVRPDGSDTKMLTSDGNNEEPSFSPDGRFIAFTSDRGGKKGIYMMRADGEAQRRVTPPEVEAYAPRWSPK